MAYTFHNMSYYWYFQILWPSNTIWNINAMKVIYKSYTLISSSFNFIFYQYNIGFMQNNKKLFVFSSIIHSKSKSILVVTSKEHICLKLWYSSHANFHFLFSFPDCMMMPELSPNMQMKPTSNDLFPCYLLSWNTLSYPAG